MIETHRSLTVCAVHFEHPRRNETTFALQYRHLALTRQRREAAGELANDRRLPRAQLRHIDLRGTEHDAVLGHGMSLVDDLRRMQQRLGGDAAHIQANSAQCRPAFDEGDRKAKVCGTKCRRVATRPGAQHEHWRMLICAGNRTRLDVRRGLGNSRSGRRRGGDRRRTWRRGRCCGSAGSGHCSGTRGDSGIRDCDASDHAALRYSLALANTDFDDRATHRRRHIHRSLVGLQSNQRRLGLDAFAHFDEHVDDRNVREVAQIRNKNVLGAHERPQLRRAGTRAAGLASAAASHVVKRTPSAPSITR